MGRITLNVIVCVSSGNKNGKKGVSIERYVLSVFFLINDTEKGTMFLGAIREKL